MFLCSKLLDGRCWVRYTVVFVHLADRCFLRFSPKLALILAKILYKGFHEGHSTRIPRSHVKEIYIISTTQPNPFCKLPTKICYGYNKNKLLPLTYFIFIQFIKDGYHILSKKYLKDDVFLEKQ